MTTPIVPTPTQYENDAIAEQQLAGTLPAAPWHHAMDGSAIDPQSPDPTAKTTSWPEGGGSGSGSYTAKAVHFNGSSVKLVNSALSAIDGPELYYSMCVRIAAIPAPSAAMFIVDPTNTAGTQLMFGTPAVSAFTVQFTDSGYNNYFTADLNHAMSLNAWHTLLVAVKTNLAAGSKVLVVYWDNAKLGSIIVNSETGSFNTGLSGLPFNLGDDEYGNGQMFDIADFRLHANKSIIVSGDIPTVTRQLFFDANNKPVDPATAMAALGAPTILFSGDATSFATNKGTGGAFTLTGALTNASSSPSDG